MVSFKSLGVALIYALPLATQVASTALPNENAETTIETPELDKRACLGGSLLACQQSKSAACTGQCAVGRPRRQLTCLHSCLGNAAKSCGDECK
ncbi:uncharacterized protein LDX57_007658 [Aspergillus melleus]|uniref:uncharacterized protein n=1 Tax=Aspergillus melleus TaxID=138277 RepID=UPI001E8EA4CF|nr:uncharacterized protein LDX57_007658 [Aspergillus melleus]KAH8429986.1 hypothetical protein LDX57_007658 [Aspergillus melleus]